MKRKSPQVKISKHKSVLIGAVLILAGFSILFFSIGLNTKRGKAEVVSPEPETNPKTNTDPSPPLAMTPRPSDKPIAVPQPSPAPESPQKSDDKTETRRALLLFRPQNPIGKSPLSHRRRFLRLRLKKAANLFLFSMMRETV